MSKPIDIHLKSSSKTLPDGYRFGPIMHAVMNHETGELVIVDAEPDYKDAVGEALTVLDIDADAGTITMGTCRDYDEQWTKHPLLHRRRSKK